MNSSKRIVLRASFVVLLVAALGICLPGNALAQDIAGSFSATNNPNGVWSYGSYTESTSTFTLLTFAGTDCGTPLPYWSSGSGGFPVVLANNTGSTVPCSSSTWTLPTDTLNLHPTDTAGVDSDVRWTAPAAGTYVISGSFSALDATTTLDSILVGGTSVFSTNIDSSNKSASFSLTETLSMGETIDFTVNCCSGSDTAYDFDSTGLQGSIEPSSAVTPEPASFFLMGSGLLAMGGILRRRSSGRRV